MRFTALDGWRGLCALLVAMYHFTASWHFQEFIRHNYLFVDFFFVLSGFVISHAYLDRLGDGVKSFVINRFGRVWPLHVAVLAAFVALDFAKGSLEPSSYYSIFTNVLMIHSLGLVSVESWNYPSWSISVEFYTYLIFALFVIFFKHYLKALSVVTILISVFVLYRYSPDYMDATLDFGIFRCLYGFLLGYLVYQLFSAVKLKCLHTALEAVCICLVVLFVVFAGRGPLSVLSPVIFAATVYVFAFEKGLFSRILTTKPFILLGAWSYSIYMVHALVGTVFKGAFTVIGQKLSIDLFDGGAISFGNAYYMDLLALVYLITVLAVAAFTYHTIELPGMAYFKRVGRSLS